MAISHKLLSGDAYFRRSDRSKIIINHLGYLDSGSIETMLEKLITVYDSDIMSSIPRCSCGALQGRYMIGTECSECGTECLDPRDRQDPVLWFEALDPELPFITPQFWSMLSNILSSSTDYLRWLSDPRYNPPTKVPSYITGAKNDVLNGERDYYLVIKNLHNLIDYFINSSELKKRTSYNDLLLLKEILIRHPDDIFSTFLPTPNSKLIVVENTAKGKYTNLLLGDIMDVIMLWMRVTQPEISFKKKSVSTGIVVSKLAGLYLKYFDKFLHRKSGVFRKHVYGARSHFTFRTVITAATGKHKHNQIIAPWLVSLTTYRPHVLNKLVNERGYSYKNADKLINNHIMTYHPVIDEIQNELIKESPYPDGLPVLANRNPSLLQGSTQLLYIKEFNKNPRVQTTTFSPLIAKAPNADFDGDALNFYPLMDIKMVELFKTLRPFYNIPDLSQPYAVSGRLSLDTPNNTILSNFLWHKSNDESTDELYDKL